MSIFRRILGVILIIVGIAGLIIALGISIYGRQLIDTVAVGLDSTIGILQDTVGTTVDSLEAAKSTINEATTTVDTVSETVGNLSTTLFDTQPLLQQVTGITTETVPNSLDAVQEAIPNLAGIASAIDTTLTRLDDLKVERVVLGVPISFDLGISYQPRTPFDEAVLQIGDSFVGLPDQLRALDDSLTVAVDNISTIGTNVSDLSTNLTDVGGTLTQFGPLLDQYIDVLNQTESSILQTQQQFEDNLNLIKWVITGLAIWFALYQLVPFYVGWRMVTDKDEDDEAQPVVVAAATPSGSVTVDPDTAVEDAAEAAEELVEKKE
ncbi:MAG: hypothetical protein R3C44_01830 [Chloroflexota bacterium]